MLELMEDSISGFNNIIERCYETHIFDRRSGSQSVSEIYSRQCDLSQIPEVKSPPLATIGFVDVPISIFSVQKDKVVHTRSLSSGG